MRLGEGGGYRREVCGGAAGGKTRNKLASNAGEMWAIRENELVTTPTDDLMGTTYHSLQRD